MPDRRCQDITDLALNFEGWHETWLAYFICRAKGSHLKTAAVFPDVFQKVFRPRRRS